MSLQRNSSLNKSRQNKLKQKTQGGYLETKDTRPVFLYKPNLTRHFVKSNHGKRYAMPRLIDIDYPHLYLLSNLQHIGH